MNSEQSEDRLGAQERERLADFYAPHTERLATLLAASGTADVPDWLRVARRV